MPPVVGRLAGRSICDHFSDERSLHIHFARERCNTLLEIYRSLLVGVNLERCVDNDSIPTSSLTRLGGRPCRAGRTCFRWLAHQSLSWALLHLDTITQVFAEARNALVEIYTEYKLDANGLQAEFEKALRKDNEDLKTWLGNLHNSDASTVAFVLQNNEAGNLHPLKELTTAFTKRIRSLEQLATEDDAPPELNASLRLAAHTLQRLSGRSPDYEIPPWCVTSFDVDFDADDAHLVGRGAFARVVEGIWNGKLVAVKELSPKADHKFAHDTIRQEVQIWSRLSHPNILPFYGACLEASKPFIISRLCVAGNALKYLKSCPDVNRIKLLHDIAVGMIYLHGQGIIHADLKASNILIGDNGEALIADFGLSQIQDQVSSSVHVTRTSTPADKVGGTFRWMATEVLEGRGLNKPADIYGFALTAWEFYTNGAVPFGSVTDAQVFFALVKKGERPERPQKIEEGVWALVQRCWSGDPYERPDFVAVERMLRGLMAPTGQESTSQVVDSNKATRSPVLSPENSPPPANSRTRKLSIAAEAEAKASLLKGLVTRKILTFSKPPKVACINPKSRDVDRHHTQSNEPGFIESARKIPSLSRLLAESTGAHSMDVVLAFLYNHSLKADGVSEILAEAGLLPAVIDRLQHHELPDNEKYLMSGLLANLACHGKGRARIATQPHTVSVLRELLAPQGSVPMQENASRCLYNLSTDDVSHRLLAESSEAIVSLGRLLSTTTSFDIVKSILGCLTNLSHKEPGRSAILSSTEAIDALVRTLGHGTEDITKEQALLCLGNLSIEEKGVTTLLGHSELIPGLAACLCRESPTPAVKAQTLRCFRNLAKSASSHATICTRPEILAAVCDVLAVRASSNQQKYALHFLHRSTSSDIGKRCLCNEARVLGCLQWFLDNGSLEEQTRAADCLNRVRDCV
ncbi:putative kinase-like protein [Lyophyllum shimeji]|uniref:Kinase-like protein n=1 Tax=Lyophyllum shimeji TaxID=47721 RepID=A0A9P3PXF3_LYOSH|nr:putative kinase-like protein [Lyophyllum shimeji]